MWLTVANKSCTQKVKLTWNQPRLSCAQCMIAEVGSQFNNTHEANISHCWFNAATLSKAALKGNFTINP